MAVLTALQKEVLKVAKRVTKTKIA